MSYSEVISEIENKGFNQALIDEFEKADRAYAEVGSLSQQLESAKQDMHEASANLGSFIQYAARNCNEWIVDNSTYGKYVLRLIDKDILYEVVKDEQNDKIIWNAYRCNTNKKGAKI